MLSLSLYNKEAVVEEPLVKYPKADINVNAGKETVTAEKEAVHEIALTKIPK